MVADHLRLLPEYGSESSVWSSAGPVSLEDLGICESLRAALVDWQNEALNASHSRALRTEAEWEADGRALSERLSAETGQPVILDL